MSSHNLAISILESRILNLNEFVSLAPARTCRSGTGTMDVAVGKAIREIVALTETINFLKEQDKK